MRQFCWTVLSAILLTLISEIGQTAETAKNTVLRDSYGNSQYVFNTTGQGRVAFLGGSITEMDGYRPMVSDYLTRKFPQTKFDFVDAGISSTCSDTGAFRLESDVLARGPIDLFFLEFAVNDNQDGFFSFEHSVRGFEGIVRHIRTVCPNVDIVVTFFVNEDLMAKYRTGNVAESIKAHEAVALKYNISTINLAKEIQERIDAKTLTWQEFGGVHPAPRGNRICTDMIESVLNEAWKTKADCLKPHQLPEQIDCYSYTNGCFRGFDGIQTADFVCEVPNWKEIPGGFRNRFAGKKLLCATKPGSSCSFEFSGTAVGLYVLAGPDAGAVDFSIDGADFQSAQLFHDYSGGLHYPRTVVLADELAAGKHKVTLRVSPNKDARSKGTAVRILEICVQKD